MLLSDFCFLLFRFLIPPALIGTSYIYFYPVLHDCTFPEARVAEAACIIPGQEKPAVPAEIAPFRLLAIGDPQLEGSSSLPELGEAPLLRSLHRIGERWREDGLAAVPGVIPSALAGVVIDDIPRALKTFHKSIDLWGNDYYLAHIYRGVYWWSEPTHTAVLGDLLGSQLMPDDEFGRRSTRFWNRVFRRATRVPRNITDVSGRIEVLGADKSWERRLIAIAGNHDIGYAGDIDDHRVDRFEDTFGRVNWEVTFRLPEETKEGSASPSLSRPSSLFDRTKPPEIRIIVSNSMNLDDPAYAGHLQQKSRDHLTNTLHTTQGDTTPNTATVLLTHIPFYKPAGVCTDGPYYDYFENNVGGRGIRSQNLLSESTSKYILDGLAGEKKGGAAIVLNGHDHPGCDTWHSRQRREPGLENAGSWGVEHFSPQTTANETHRAIREITVRSMMGAYGGNMGLLSGWFDRDAGEWRFAYKPCQFWIQHVWWFVHILDLVVVLLGLTGLGAFAWEIYEEIQENNRRAEATDQARVDGKKVKTL